VGDVKLIIIDPISAYMGQAGKLDTHRNTDVRATLAPLQDLAAQLDIAIVVLSHLTKGTRDGAISRVTGSGAFVAAARAAYIVEKEMESEEDEDGKSKMVDTGRRLFLPIKNNLADDKTGFAYRVVVKTNVYDKYDPPMEIRIATIEWDDEIVTITADEALAPPGEKSSGAGEVRDFLREYLSSGPVPQKQVEAAAAQRGFSEDRLKYAKKKLKVETNKKPGNRGAWMWRLPGDKRGTQGNLADIVLGSGELPDEPPPVDEEGHPLG
jgi:putative DNA primase/helicase